MIDRNGTKQDVTSQQEAMLRLAERDHGLTTARLSAETGIPAVTIRSWKRECAPVAMSLGDFVAVCRVIPDHLTSLCLEPAGKQILGEGEGEAQLHKLLAATADHTSDHIQRMADGKLCHVDRAALKESAGRIADLAIKVARA